MLSTGVGVIRMICLDAILLERRFPLPIDLKHPQPCLIVMTVWFCLASNIPKNGEWEQLFFQMVCREDDCL